MGYDFEPREIQSFDVAGDLAPEIGQPLARYRRPGVPPGELVTEYGSGPWLVVDVLPITGAGVTLMLEPLVLSAL